MKRDEWKERSFPYRRRGDRWTCSARNLTWRVLECGCGTMGSLIADSGKYLRCAICGDWGKRDRDEGRLCDI